MTPIDELSLIAFPRASCSEKLGTFDLGSSTVTASAEFFRCSTTGILQPMWKMAERFMASGPNCQPMGISRTPPGVGAARAADREIVTQGFKPMVTARASPAVTETCRRKHRHLCAKLGRWFRVVVATKISGDGDERSNDRPLLVLEYEAGPGRGIAGSCLAGARGFEAAGRAELLRWRTGDEGTRPRRRLARPSPTE
jgi:hypothetical protein